jgi:hypothetical protein
MAQFYKGKIEGYEQTFETSNILDLLPYDKLADLKDYDNIGKPYQRYFKAERVLALVEAYKVKSGDASGRDGLQVRGILYKFDKEVDHDGLKYPFPESQIIDMLTSGKRVKMPPLPVPLVKPLPIDSIPLLEWEVQP